jgi:hypothetical protein
MLRMRRDRGLNAQAARHHRRVGGIDVIRNAGMEFTTVL